MPYVSRSKQVFYCVVMVLSAFAVDLFQSSGSLAQIPDDYVCYIQRSNGQTIDLGKLCGSSGRGRPIALQPNDQAFINNYQRSLSKRLNSSSSDAVSRVQRNPQAAIERARGICNALSGGMSIDLLQPKGNAEVDALNALAPKYYCPEFDD
ncbi:DUF732 domain-containing protein [Microcoleus sp. D3_18a_C4]|uniref:DUF732 domain-containing protein n=1 Tax=unclassified Microcoleus TaxID=2642155 RepID=UPI002FD05567